MEWVSLLLVAFMAALGAAAIILFVAFVLFETGTSQESKGRHFAYSLGIAALALVLLIPLSLGVYTQVELSRNRQVAIDELVSRGYTVEVMQQSGISPKTAYENVVLTKNKITRVCLIYTADTPANMRVFCEGE